MRTTRLKYTIVAFLVLVTSTLAPDNTEYVIFPKPDLESKELLGLQNTIETLAGGSPRVYASVEKIAPNNVIMESFAQYARQSLAPKELRMVSQPPSSESLDHFKDYVFRADVRREIFVYHAELGIDQKHEDFHGRRIEWLYTPLTRRTGNAVPRESPYADDEGHGTCTASKAMGNIHGAAKFATLVVVKMPAYTIGAVTEVFATIADDVREKGRQYSSVVSVSWGSKFPLDEKAFPRMSGYMSELTSELHVPIVFAAGNSALEESGRRPRRRTDAGPAKSRLITDTWPAAFVDRYGRWGALAVANCDFLGKRFPESQRASRNNIFAPGVDIKCAHAGSARGYRVETGTSFSAPLTAGVIAHMMATEEIWPSKQFSPERWDMSQILAYAGWQRPGGEYVLWNRVDTAHNRPSFDYFNQTSPGNFSNVAAAVS
ncbi:MAG: hypothetical protein LQ348_002798 [Seirophora lacunosa]|nr:MAG: hypothetical protein LQ344_001474 [Seirophora lacunosa]KAI4193694.1 MAG: hypothetical protein LQ348_002798 [Seirophora lacunosa]